MGLFSLSGRWQTKELYCGESEGDGEGVVYGQYVAEFLSGFDIDDMDNEYALPFMDGWNELVTT